MKKVVIVLFLVISIKGFGQSLFFDKLENSVWISVNPFNDSTFNQKVLQLSFLKTPKDSLSISCTLWTFSNELVISNYNASTRKDSILAKYPYQADKQNGSLNLIVNGKERITYNIEIPSARSFVLLNRKKVKRLKADSKQKN